MSSKKQKLQVMGAFAALATLALAVSCRGFFVNPTLTGVSVGPSGLNLNVNQTWQMTATGTYSDGSQKTLSSGVAWSSSDATAVSVSQGGLVTALSQGSSTITASSGGCSACTGSTSVSVVLQNITAITVSPSSQTATRNGTTVYFKATASPGGDITQGATWNVVDSSGTNQNSNFSISFVSGSGEGFLPSSSATVGTYTINVTYPGTTVVGTATLTVN
jgi:hypothetical protein